MDFLPKICVRNKKESTTAQKQFFKLGIFWGGVHDYIISFKKNEYPVFLYSTDAGQLKWSTKDFKEITIDELNQWVINRQ